MTKTFYIGLCAMATLFASCSDVELEATRYSETVRNLKKGLHSVRKQIETTYKNTVKTIEITFDVKIKQQL